MRAEIWILSRLGGWLEKEKWQKFVSCAIIKLMPEWAVFEKLAKRCFLATPIFAKAP